MTDHPVDTAAGGQAELGQLGALARTGLASDDDHLVVADRLDEFVAPRADRQRLGHLDRARREEGGEPFGSSSSGLLGAGRAGSGHGGFQGRASGRAARNGFYRLGPATGCVTDTRPHPRSRGHG